MTDATLLDAHADDVIGARYILLEPLGSGGMARVFRARDTKLGRDVALKLLHPHLAEDPTFRARIQREARAAAALTHPNVVGVHDVGEDERDAWIVMELVASDTLRDVLQTRGRLTPGECVSLLQPTAIGLGAAHDQGLVHRDVKPENILLGIDGRVKVSDFGLARASADQTITMASSVIVGSPHYLAPEVINSNSCDARTDVYALGVVLFECLTGRPPFEAETALATALRHTTDRVPRPSLVVPGISAELDALVLKATDPDPDERHLDATAFADDLVLAVPEGSVAVDLRDGERNTVVIPLTAAETQVSSRAGTIPATGSRRKRERLERKAEQAAKAGKVRKVRRRGRRLLITLVLVGALAGGGYVGWDRYVAPVVEVPDAVGQNGAEAIPALREAGFDVRISDERPFDRLVPAGHVLSVAPSTGARRGSRLLVVLSAGPRQVTVPGVIGDTIEVAAATLGAEGFELEVIEVFDAAPAGTVVSTVPAAGEITNDGLSVRIEVSKGREPATIPSVVGLGEAEAQAILRERGFDPTIVERRFDELIPAGDVASQTPLADEDGFVGDAVELMVSDGPEPFALGSYAGELLGQTRAKLEELGLQVEVELVDTSFAERRGRVDSHAPAPGQEVRRGDTVTLYVWN